MPRANAFLVPVVSTFALALVTCSRPEEPLEPSLAVGSCSVTLTRAQANPLTVSPNSTNNNASWFIRNSGTGPVTLNGQVLVPPKLPVTAVRLNTWTSFPRSLAPGDQIDADVRFDVGASGSGTASVGLTVKTSCGDKALPLYGVTVSAPPQVTGIPFGPQGLFKPDNTLQTVGAAAFTLVMDGVTASNVKARIASARAKNVKLLMNMTGGPHSHTDTGDYLSVINGELQFDMKKWTDKMDTYRRTANAAAYDAIVEGVGNGTIIGNSVMDEPFVHAGPEDGNTWGPKGTMTKARVDQMCSYVKGIFPTLAVGVSHDHMQFDSTSSYRVCDFIVDQYSYRLATLTKFLNEGLAMANRDGYAVIFGMNVLNGGPQDKVDGIYDCNGGRKGNHFPNCAMTSDEVRLVGKTLGVAGCAMNLWRYDATYMTDPAINTALIEIRDLLKTKPPKACRRT